MRTCVVVELVYLRGREDIDAGASDRPAAGECNPKFMHVETTCYKKFVANTRSDIMRKEKRAMEKLGHATVGEASKGRIVRYHPRFKIVRDGMVRVP